MLKESVNDSYQHDTVWFFEKKHKVVCYARNNTRVYFLDKKDI